MNSPPDIFRLAQEAVEFEGKERCGIFSAIIEVLARHDLFGQGSEISKEIIHLVYEEKRPGRRTRWIIRSATSFSEEQLTFSIGA
jgi:hypothetical protein